MVNIDDWLCIITAISYHYIPEPARTHPNPPEPTRTRPNPPEPTRTHPNPPVPTRTRPNPAGSDFFGANAVSDPPPPTPKTNFC